MKVFSKQEFGKLPAGTFYATGNPWFFEHLAIKLDSIYSDGEFIDWYYRDFCWIESPSSDDAIDRLDEMLEHGVSYPMRDAIERDGCYDENVFLVYERDDLLKLRGYIEEAIKLPHLLITRS